jgi:hypothetical protein
MPTAADWIDVWERARAVSAPFRPLALLQHAERDGAAGLDALARLSIGERDRRLLALRETLFGGAIECVATCPACGERLELSFASGDIREPAATSVGDLELEAAGYRVTCRAPNSLDLAAVAHCPDVATAHARLFERCVVAVRRDTEPLAAEALPEPVRVAVDDALAAHDPAAVITLAVTCPGCGHAWAPLFDVATHLWEELERWVLQLTHNVHVLASAYGWREQDVLAMSALRRARYLQLAAGLGA